MTQSQPSSKRATLRRNAIRAEYDDAVIQEILQAQQVCHVAYVKDGEPRQIATLYFADQQYLYLHGNRTSALLVHMAAGGEVSISVMLVDGVVVARSGFHCSMNYRSVTLYGKGEAVTGETHVQALDAFVAKLIPGHEKVVRPSTSQELAATAVVRVPLTEMVAKVRGGDPIDADQDLESDVWAGTIDLTTHASAPKAAANLAPHITLPDYLKHYKVKG